MRFPPVLSTHYFPRLRSHLVGYPAVSIGVAPRCQLLGSRRAKRQEVQLRGIIRTLNVRQSECATDIPSARNVRHPKRLSHRNRQLPETRSLRLSPSLFGKSLLLLSSSHGTYCLPSSPHIYCSSTYAFRLISEHNCRRVP